MYELANGQLTQVVTVTSPRQPGGQAVIRSHFAAVTGYDSAEVIDFETVPEKQEIAGKVAELHYFDGQLYWEYVDIPPQIDQRIEALEAENITLKLALAELAEMIAGGK